MTRLQRDQLMEQMRAAEPFDDSDIDALRVRFVEMMSAMEVPADLRTRETELGGRPALEVLPAAEPRPGTLLYFHGGAYVIGSPATAMAITGGLVARTGRRALSLDYRLAPEHPFPAAMDDAFAAYRALLDDGVDPAQIALAGDSAGGGLAVATALAARDAGLPLPAAIAGFSAFADHTLSGESVVTRAGDDPLFVVDEFRATLDLSLVGADPLDPRLSPAVTGELTGLPALLLQAGTAEILLDDSTRLAARARAADVDVTLDIVSGVPHVYQTFVGILDEAGAALDRAALFLTQQLG